MDVTGIHLKILLSFCARISPSSDLPGNLPRLLVGGAFGEVFGTLQLQALSQTLGKFPISELEGFAGHEPQVFNLQQRAMGEALAGGKEGCIGINDFTSQMSDQQFAQYFHPMSQLLDEAASGQKIFERLRLTLEHVRDLRRYSSELLGASQHE